MIIQENVIYCCMIIKDDKQTFFWGIAKWRLNKVLCRLRKVKMPKKTKHFCENLRSWMRNPGTVATSQNKPIVDLEAVSSEFLIYSNFASRGWLYINNSALTYFRHSILRKIYDCFTDIRTNSWLKFTSLPVKFSFSLDLHILIEGMVFGVCVNLSLSRDWAIFCNLEFYQF